MDANTVEPVSSTGNFSELLAITAQHQQGSFAFVTLVSMSVVVLPGNLLAIAAFVKEEELRMPCNFLICNQSVIDALSALFALPYAFFNYHASGVKILNQNKYICIFAVSSASFFVASSAFNILTISAQRMIFVLFPQASKSPKLSSITWMVILLNHSIIFIYFSLPFFGLSNWRPGGDLRCVYFEAYPQVYTSVGVLLCASPLFGVVGSNLFIYQRYNKQKRLVQSACTVGAANNQTKKDWKLTMMPVTVAVAFLASWTPLIILDVIQRVFPGVKSVSAFWIALDISHILVLANGLVNPLIYVGKNQRFKVAFKKILGIK